VKLQLVHVDLYGPHRTAYFNGSKYFIAFINDMTQMRWIYILMFKSEVPEVFWKFKLWYKIKVVAGFKCLDQIRVPSTHLIDLKSFVKMQELSINSLFEILHNKMVSVKGRTDR